MDTIALILSIIGCINWDWLESFSLILWPGFSEVPVPSSAGSFTHWWVWQACGRSLSCSGETDF